MFLAVINILLVTLRQSFLRSLDHLEVDCVRQYAFYLFLCRKCHLAIPWHAVVVPYLTKYYDNTLVCYSYSKSLSIPGERVGYLLIPDEAEESDRIIAASAIGVRVLGCVNAPSLQQLAIIKVLNVLSDVDAYAKNRKALMDAMDAAGFEYVVPKGTFYMFVKTPIEDDKAFVTKAKDEFHVLCSSGAAFDCPGWVRFAFCVDYDMIVRATPHIIAVGHAYGLN